MGSAAELFDLKGRVALVTGASSGLGVRFASTSAKRWKPVGAWPYHRSTVRAAQVAVRSA